MKTPEEIEKLAAENIGYSYPNYNLMKASWIAGYTKSQQDSCDKKYTENDLRKAFGKGHARGYQERACEENYNPVTGFEPKNKEATFEEFIQSLKK